MSDGFELQSTGGWTRTNNRINQSAYEADSITTSDHTGICTESGTRTHTSMKTPAFEAGASTSSAISAFCTLGRTRTDKPIGTVSKTAVYTNSTTRAFEP